MVKERISIRINTGNVLLNINMGGKNTDNGKNLS